MHVHVDAYLNVPDDEAVCVDTGMITVVDKVRYGGMASKSDIQKMYIRTCTCMYNNAEMYCLPVVYSQPYSCSRKQSENIYSTCMHVHSQSLFDLLTYMTYWEM